MNAQTPSLVPKRTQAPCCYTSAMDDEATWCADCGKPLIRCMAFEECGGLLDNNGLCTVCVAPHVQVAPGAISAVRVGGAVALPIKVANLSAVGRPLFVTSMLIREGGEAWIEQDLGWERLHAGEQRPVTIRAASFDRPGVHNVECLLAVASRWRWREEKYAFRATFTFDVKENREAAGHVVHIQGGDAAHGNIVNFSGKEKVDSTTSRSDEAIELALVRADLEERQRGLRGLDNESVPRSVPFSWEGFPEADAPFEGPLLSLDGILAVGRSRSRRDGGLGDVRLLPETGDGQIDEDLSRQISRRHFELYIESDRLVLRVTGGGGLRVNGDAYGRDKTVVLSGGDVIAPLVQNQEEVSMRVRFQSHHGRVSRVTFTRDPVSHNVEPSHD